jgi:hypothetical protein
MITLFLFSEHAHPVILLWDVKADDLKLLFNFMYEGQVNVAQERLSTFLTLAERLQVRGLTSTTGDGVLNRTAAVAAVKSIVPLVTPSGSILCNNFYIYMYIYQRGKNLHIFINFNGIDSKTF